jgi:hypothetical protein
MPTNRADHRLLSVIKEISSRIGLVRDAVSATGEATVEAMTENTKAYQKANEPMRPGKLERVSIGLSAEEARRYYGDQDKMYRLQRRTFWATVGTLLAVAGYAVITYMQWCQMKRATNLSEKANRTLGYLLTAPIKRL